VSVFQVHLCVSKIATQLPYKASNGSLITPVEGPTLLPCRHQEPGVCEQSEVPGRRRCRNT